MDRRSFSKFMVASAGTMIGGGFLMKQLFKGDNALFAANSQPNIKSYFFKDDGKIPNNVLPLLIYKSAVNGTGSSAADHLEKIFAANNWTNTWRWGVYPFHHYHSNTHEVLGCFQGSALLHLGGSNGQKITLSAGDIVIIPAGVGHKCISHTDDFTVLGAYPDGLSPDLNKGENGERPQTDRNIAAVKLPKTDPFFGNNQGILQYWVVK